MMKVLRIIYLALIGLFIVSGVACNTANNNETAAEDKDVKGLEQTAGIEVVEASKVCMVNNMYMGGKEQIKIEADGKTYYGCCVNCINQIENNTNNVRIGKDPLTGEEVDKAKAFIVKKENDDLLYFASKENYEKYLEKQVQ